MTRQLPPWPRRRRDRRARRPRPRARGNRGPSRLIETLFAADGPVSAQEGASGLGGTRAPVDDASVYANLEALEELGLVGHVRLGHDPGLWTLADRARREFLHCERCGTWRAVEPSVLAEERAAIRRATGYEVRFTHFPLAGLSPECAPCRPAAVSAVLASRPDLIALGRFEPAVDGRPSTAPAGA